MKNENTKDIDIKAVWKLVLISLTAAISGSLWLYGLFNSPVIDSKLDTRRQYLEEILTTRAPDYEQEKKLATAYWQRYPDVRKDRLWGENGRMGVRGPRDHYRLHGRREGRIWGE